MAQNDIERELTKQLSAYTDAVAAKVKQAVKATAEDTKTQLRKTSPGTRYRRGWSVVVRKETPAYMVCGVQNRLYRLTHLLENSHKLRNGGRTDPANGFGGRVHIAPAAEAAAEDLSERVERIIEETK
ncbi:HK97 gp10 family phage protein [Galactobacillus timonensis]|uniref:HK97 gp10 family phage protein n=1 Tax=Galactobacillus timonensis TaxID=2041840 RepID=UPI000C82CE07|nr:HK97 gp10 family phage protein [Galactobacillus timonensis]